MLKLTTAFILSSLFMGFAASASSVDLFEKETKSARSKLAHQLMKASVDLANISIDPQKTAGVDLVQVTKSSVDLSINCLSQTVADSCDRLIKSTSAISFSAINILKDSKNIHIQTAVQSLSQLISRNENSESAFKILLEQIEKDILELMTQSLMNNRTTPQEAQDLSASRFSVWKGAKDLAPLRTVVRISDYLENDMQRTPSLSIERKATRRSLHNKVQILEILAAKK